MTKSINQINQIINSVFGMNLKYLQGQLISSSEIVRQVIDTDAISFTKSLPYLKLLVYKLIIKLVQNQQASTKEIIYDNPQNKSNMLVAQIKSIIYATKQMLGQLSHNKQMGRVKSKTEKHSTVINPVNTLLSYQEHLSNLINQYESCIHDSQSTDQEGQNAFIEQLEAVITKKQQIIEKQNYEISLILQRQKDMEEIIERLKIQIEVLEEQSELLKSQLEKHQRQIQIRQSMKVEEKHKSQKYYKDQKSQKDQADLNQEQGYQEHQQQLLSQINSEIQNNLNSQNIEKFLLAQALSLQAMLTPPQNE